MESRLDVDDYKERPIPAARAGYTLLSLLAEEGYYLNRVILQCGWLRKKHVEYFCKYYRHDIDQHKEVSELELILRISECQMTADDDIESLGDELTKIHILA